jgi:hypothetical protein
MSRIVFSLQTKSGIGELGFGRALRSPLTISLKADGTDSGPLKTSVGGFFQRRRLQRFLTEYRRVPGRTKPDQEIRILLHRFLFADGRLDGLFGTSVALAREIVVTGEAQLLRLIANIPWELADGIGVGQGALLGTLAAMPLKRVITGSQTRLDVKPEGQLDVLYCISRAPNDTSLDAPAFQQAFSSLLADYEGYLRVVSMLGSDAVGSPQYSTRFDQLLAKLEKNPPNILFIVCHGRTQDGRPELNFAGQNGFDWFPVARLGEVLGKQKQTFLVILLACDLTHHAEGHAAHSGAVTLIQHGVPFVVAMQSSVLVKLAKKFIGTVIGRFFENPNLAECVAAGRKSMTTEEMLTSDYADWSFPALFETTDARECADQLRCLIDSFQLVLRQLHVAIPVAKPYFNRESVDAQLHELFTSLKTGTCLVTGPIGRGKTHSIRHTCREILRLAISHASGKTRKIFYLDCDQAPLNGPRQLMDKIAVRNRELASPVFGQAPLKWASVRGAEGTGQGSDPMLQLVGLIDYNRVVLVIDNISEQDSFPWREFIAAANGLQQSLVIIATRSAFTAHDEPDFHVEVSNLNEEQTRKYITLVAADRVSEARAWYERSGGILLFLNQLRLGDVADFAASLVGEALTEEAPPTTIVRVLASSANSDFPELCEALSLLRHGITTKLAKWLDLDTKELPRLEQSGVLTRDGRYAREDHWYMPALFREVWSGEKDARDDLVWVFVDRLKQGGDVAANLHRLMETPGGPELIEDLQALLIQMPATLDVARRICVLAEEWLFSHGRIVTAFRLWDSYLKATEFARTTASQWVSCGAAARILGNTQIAQECLAKAKARNPNAFERISLLNLEASIHKDSGAFDNAGATVRLYHEAVQAVQQCRRLIAEGKLNNVSARELDEKEAFLTYNQAIFTWYWLDDNARALDALYSAEKEFSRLGNGQMAALAAVEWAEVQLDSLNAESNWPVILEKFLSAVAYFEGDESRDPLSGAFSYYQLARYYRRRAACFPDQKAADIEKALDAYNACVRTAAVAADLRQEMIARLQILEICWRDTSTEGDESALRQVEEVIGALEVFRDDRWSERCLRDALMLKADILARREDPAALDCFKRAFQIAKIPSLDPNEGTDAQRAAYILLRLLRLTKNGIESDTLIAGNQSLVQQWLHLETDGLTLFDRTVWEDKLADFASKPGDYHGNTKR